MASSVLALAPEDAPKLPSHIAIIMDGNGRWAEHKGVARAKGHQAGSDALKRVLEACRERPYLRYLTVYAFSSENWKRDPAEVQDLMALLRHYLKYEVKNLLKEKIRLRFIGDRSALSEDIQHDLHDIETQSAKYSEFNLTIALSYGSRQELVGAMQRIAADIQAGKLQASAISESTVDAYLDTAGMPAPDLLIRTGGEERLSNFLLWQSAYTELYFCETLWPDFSGTELEQAIQCYSQRERRFGARHGNNT